MQLVNVWNFLRNCVIVKRDGKNDVSYAMSKFMPPR